MPNRPETIQLDALHSGAVTSSGHAKAIRLALFNRIMCNHRALSLLFPLIAALIIATLDTKASLFTISVWAGAVCLVWLEIAIFSARYFAGKLPDDPDRLSRSLALRYFNANVVWSAMFFLFWYPQSETQNFFLLLLFISHLSVATATTSYEWRIYFACTLPITLATTVVTLQSGDNVYIGVGCLIVMVYAFTVTVARQVIAQSTSAIALRLEHDDLIRDLASAKGESDAALRQAEAANTRLAGREQRFRALVDNAFDGIMIASSDGIIQFATDAVARMFNATPGQLTGRDIPDLATDDIRAKTKEAVESLAASSGQLERFAGWAETMTGDKIWIEATGRNMIDDPNVNGVVFNIRDATARKRADHVLQMHLGVLEKLATGAGMTDVLNELTVEMEALNPETRASILLLDDEGCLRLGSAPSMPPEYAQVFDGMTASREAGPCGEAMVTGKLVIIPDSRTHPEFATKQELIEALGIGSMWSQPIASRDGTILGAVAMIYETDRSPLENELEFLNNAAQLAAIVIERWRAEQRLAEALRTAEIANHSKSQFLANMSHELRTPLNAIIGFSEMIREEMFGPIGVPEYADYIRDIHSSGRHLLELINDILDISKIEAGQFELEECWIDLNTVAKWSLELVRHRAEQGGVHMVIEDLQGLPEIYVDERSVKQVLLNLMSNATKFTPAGGTVTLSATHEPGGDMVIKLRDTGIGIEPHMIERVMEPFGQAEGPMTRNFGGTGLGLPITKSLAEMHGGTLTLESQPGEGTCVTITIPAWRTSKDAVGARPAEAAE